LEFAKEFGFGKHTDDFDRALAAPEIDAFVIASPSPLHYAHAKKSLEAGKDVLVEIPLAMRYSEGAELVELARQRNLKLMVCHSQRFNPSLAATRRRVQEGSLRVHHLLIHFGAMRRGNVGWLGKKRDWLDNILWHTSCHFVDCSMWLLGANRVQVAAQVGPPDPELGIPMDIDLILRTPAAELISISISYNSHLGFHQYLVIGEQDSFLLDSGRLIGPEGVRDDPATRGVDFMRVGWEAQDREFLAALHEDRQPAVAGVDVLPALAVLQQVQDSFMADALQVKGPDADRRS
jgi:2-hydroxy-4-carboxymuconate semialdehyde hemiacetal dehydrogenase